MASFYLYSFIFFNFFAETKADLLMLYKSYYLLMMSLVELRVIFQILQGRK